MRFFIHPLFFLAIAVAIFFSATDFLIALTVAVLLHELAHAVIAKQVGAVVSSITLTPFGGALKLQSKILTPYQQNLIYWAGPIASLLLSLFFGVMVWLFPTFFMFFEYLVVANFIVGVVNLLPIYPLDGSKILVRYLPAKIVFIGSDICMLIVLIVAFVLHNWWWIFFTVMVLLQINWDFRQSIYSDKFNYTNKPKIGQFVRCAVLSSTTLFQAYRLVDTKHPTEFVIADKNQFTFLEKDLEQWLISYSSDTELGQCIKNKKA